MKCLYFKRLNRNHRINQALLNYWNKYYFKLITFYFFVFGLVKQNMFRLHRIFKYIIIIILYFYESFHSIYFRVRILFIFRAAQWYSRYVEIIITSSNSYCIGFLFRSWHFDISVVVLNLAYTMKRCWKIFTGNYRVEKRWCGRCSGLPKNVIVAIKPLYRIILLRVLCSISTVISTRYFVKIALKPVATAYSALMWKLSDRSVDLNFIVYFLYVLDCIIYVQYATDFLLFPIKMLFEFYIRSPAASNSEKLLNSALGSS